MKRRTALATIGAITTTGLAGCSSTGTTFECDISETETVESLPTPTYGPTDVENTVALFEDYACPHCRDFHLNVFPSIKEKVSSDDTPAFHIQRFDTIIPVSEWSWDVANAARYIQDTVSDDAFYQFTEQAYRVQSNYSWEAIGEIVEGQSIEATPCGVIQAGKTDQYNPVLEADRTFATEELSVTQTPTVVVNGTVLDEISWDTVKQNLI